MKNTAIYPGSFDPITYGHLDIIKRALKVFDKVIVAVAHTSVVDYVKRRKLRIVIRGLRMISDFEYEFQMALTNRKLSKDVETIFMMPSESYSYLSSKLIKEAASLGANLKGFVPGFVEKAIKAKLKQRTGELGCGIFGKDI